MAGRRHWRNWPRRFGQELNGTSGYVGAGGALVPLLSFPALNSLTGVAAAVLSGTAGVGAVVAVGVIGLSAYRAIPPKLQSPGELEGKPLSLDKLQAAAPSLPKVGIVGPALSGKSTLVNKICSDPRSATLTQQVVAYVVTGAEYSDRHFALIDASGDNYPQQFRVAGLAEFLCIVLDHNPPDIERTMDTTRIAVHQDFLKQLRNYLVEERSGRPFDRICLLLNKRDLWELAPDPKFQELKDFFGSEVNNWRASNWARESTGAYHSNSRTEDVERLKQAIAEFLARR